MRTVREHWETFQKTLLPGTDNSEKQLQYARWIFFAGATASFKVIVSCKPDEMEIDLLALDRELASFKDEIKELSEIKKREEQAKL